jgi:hypothetical protein
VDQFPSKAETLELTQEKMEELLALSQCQAAMALVGKQARLVALSQPQHTTNMQVATLTPALLRFCQGAISTRQAVAA